MRLVTSTDPGVLELSYMWLPTFIGLDAILQKQLEETLAKDLSGKEVTEELLDWAHARVMDLICERYPLEGLRDYLDSVKFVRPA